MKLHVILKETSHKDWDIHKDIILMINSRRALTRLKADPNASFPRQNIRRRIRYDYLSPCVYISFAFQFWKNAQRTYWEFEMRCLSDTWRSQLDLFGT